MNGWEQVQVNVRMFTFLSWLPVISVVLSNQIPNIEKTCSSSLYIVESNRFFDFSRRGTSISCRAPESMPTARRSFHRCNFGILLEKTYLPTSAPDDKSQILVKASNNSKYSSADNTSLFYHVILKSRTCRTCEH